MSELKAGAARIDITPPLGAHLQGYLTDRVSDNIHDPLQAKALVLDNGAARVALVVCDLIALIGPVVERARSLIAAECGIAAEQVMVSATHTHYGPATMDIALVPQETAYLNELPRKIADAVMLAVHRLQPARVGFAAGSCPTEVHNRRHHLRDGTVKMNPPPGSPDIVEPAGPTDPTLSVLVARTPERRPIGVLANLALHYVGSRALDISADYFGAFDRALQRCAGEPLVAIMSNGCAGDINNIDFSRPRGPRPSEYFEAQRVANVVAGEAWKAWNTLWEEDFHADVALGGRIEKVLVKPRRPTPEQVAAGRDYVAAHQFENDPWRYCYAREQVLMAEDFPAEIELPIQAVRVGEVGFVGLPGEVFAAIGLRIRGASPFAHTVCISLANDCAGYVPTDEGLAQGGYETELCRWAYVPEGTEGQWVAAAGRLLGDLVDARDGETGEPVQGAEATIYGWPGLGRDEGEGFCLRAVTDADGAVDWAVPVGGDGGAKLYPMVRARGYHEWRDYVDRHRAGEQQSFSSIGGEGTHTISVSLKRGPTLAGRVTDEAGQPVAGAGLRLTLAGPDWCGWPHVFTFGGIGTWPPAVTTDEDGRFEWLSFLADEAAERGARWVMVAEHEAHEPAMAQSLETWPMDEERVIQIPLVLSRGVELTGRVVGPVGEAVAGATVSARAEWRIDQPSCVQFTQTAASDAEGRFCLRGLPARKHELTVCAERMAPKTVEADPRLDAPEPVIELEAGCVVEGRLLDREGSPAAGAELQLSVREPWLHREARTGEDGRFGIAGLPAAGAAELTAFHRDKYDCWEFALPAADLQLRLREPVALDVRLVAEADGSPLTGFLSIHGGGFSRRVEIGPDGPVQPCELPPCRHELFAQVPDLAMAEAAVDRPPVGMAEPLVIRVAVGSALRGHVTGPGGDPLGGVKIEAQARPYYDRREGATDADGRFELLGLNDKDYVVAFSADGLAVHVERDVRPGPELAVAMGPGATLTGRVVTPAGRPLPNVLIQARDPGGRSPVPLPSTLTDGDGRFHLARVAAGRRTIAAGAETRDLDVAHGETHELTFEVEP
ncbi:MAG: carboxypeptidase regulatory-like domain-containing protein [Armatimonadetes bacterium]|nr:carboxypeptidase regulatory-like domain-containing protein [Armatimonadota bacterium]